MRFIYPVDWAQGRIYCQVEGLDHGCFGVGQNQFWHGGVHLTPGPTEPVRAIGDGEIVAYRVAKELVGYEGPVPADTRPEDRPKYAGGFVLVRHEVVTPRGQTIEFFSLYMHLRPVTEDETKEVDTSDYPFVFKRTGWVVGSDVAGGGQPILDADAHEQQGVIPFEARFTVQPDDGKCTDERYQRVVLYPEITGYALIDDTDTILLDPKVKRDEARVTGRLRVGEPAAILGENHHPLPQKIDAQGFYRMAPVPKAHWAAGYRYERVVPIPAETKKAITRLEHGRTQLKELGSSAYREVVGELDIFDEHGTAGEAIPRGAIVKMAAGTLPAWTHDASHRQRSVEYHLVEWFEPRVRGFIFIKNAKTGAQAKTTEALDVWSGPDTLTDHLPNGADYLVLERRERDDPWIDRKKYYKVTIPDYTAPHPVDGYAFIRRPWMTALPVPAPAPAGGTMFAYGSSALHAVPATSILRSLAPEAETPDKLEPFSVFAVLPDAATTAEHWSRTARWRKVRYLQPALGAQGALTRDGYVFGGPHLVDRGPVDPEEPRGDRTYQVKPWSEIEPLRLSDHTRTGDAHRPLPFLPPMIAIQSFDGEGKRRAPRFHQVERIPHPNTRSWDGRDNGVEVRETADRSAPVRGILGAGRLVPWREAPAYTRKQTARGIAAELSGAAGFHALTGGGHVQVPRTPTDLVKRCEIPLDELKWGDVARPDPPIPIRLGDVVGYPGRYKAVPSLLHFEIFTRDHSFTGNPRGDTWGDKKYAVDASSARISRDLEIAVHTVPARSGLKVVERDSGFSQVELLESPDGWLSESSLVPLAHDAPASPRTLAAEVPHLYAELKQDGTNFTLDDKSHEVRIPGLVGDKVVVLERKGDCLRVHTLLGEVRGGWIDESALADGHADRKLEPALTTYRYILHVEAQLFATNPNLGHGLLSPKGDEKTALDARVATLSGVPPSKKFELTLKRLRRSRGYAMEPDAAGVLKVAGSVTEWVGLSASDDGHDDTWVPAAAVTPVSEPYTWRGWEFLEEDRTTEFSEDGFCDAARLLALVKPDAPLADLKKLEKMACWHPSEWDAAHNEVKFKRLKDAPWNLNAADFKANLDHFAALQFWHGSLGSSKVWHFHPLGFIDHLRKLGWLTRAELCAVLVEATAADVDRYLVKLNDVLEKYEITTPELIAHFLSQIGWESGHLSATIEGPHPDYTGVGGNAMDSDTRRFPGRGLIQDTGRGSYEEYELFTGTDVTSSDAAASRLGTFDPAVDSAGIYFRYHGKRPGAVERLGAQTSPYGFAKGKSDLESIRAVTCSVNGAYNALGSRLVIFERARRRLLAPPFVPVDPAR